MGILYIQLQTSLIPTSNKYETIMALQLIIFLSAKNYIFIQMIKKKLGIIIFLIFMILVLISIITYPAGFYNNINETLTVWLYNVYPAIFTFYIIASALINFNIISKITFIIKPFIKFNTNKAYELFLISILIGNPTSSSLIIDELSLENITKFDANKLLSVNIFFNPLFIISIIGFAPSIKYAYVIVLSMIITSIFWSWFYPCKEKIITKSKPLIFKTEKVFDSITRAMYLLIIVAGVMVFANILKFSIENIINPTNENFIFLINNIEASTGVIDIINLNLMFPITILLITFILSFQGISINTQVYTIIKDYNFNFKKILFQKGLQGFLASILAFTFTLLLL